MVTALVATGGTISSTSMDRGSRSSQSGSALLEQAGIQDDVDVLDWRTAGSFALSSLDMFALAVSVGNVIAAGSSEVVVTHGTDSMEETVFAIALVLGAAAVVVTGAQRPFDDPAPDGPHNLRAAIAMARTRGVAQLGPLLAFDDLGFQARGVRKVDTSRSPAFDAPGRGPVVRMGGATPRLLSRGHVVHPLAGLDRALGHLPAEAPYVPVVPMAPGSDGTMLRAVTASRPVAVVLQAMGCGNASPTDVEVAAELAGDGCAVFVTSRVHAGPVRPVYAGAGAALAAAGALFCDDLSPWQARILASACALVRPLDPLAPAGEWLARDTSDAVTTSP